MGDWGFLAMGPFFIKVWLFSEQKSIRLYSRYYEVLISSFLHYQSLMIEFILLAHGFVTMSRSIYKKAICDLADTFNIEILARIR